MIPSSKRVTFAIVFAVSFSVIYVIAAEVNLPVLTFHPVIGELDIGRSPARTGPAMYWYGWMLTSLIGATGLAFAATMVPERWLQWIILVGALAAGFYLIVYTIALLIYDQASIELAWLQSRWVSAILAVMLTALVGLMAPAGWSKQLWPGWTWLVPGGALTVLGYFLLPYFTH
jgi:hypothetical protein